MKAVWSDTRAACCMLCVTITTVTSPRSVYTSSSMRCVLSGSSAVVGSSSRSTRGAGASARARQSRCCWPPESVIGVRIEAMADLVPQPGALQREFHAIIALRTRRAPGPIPAGRPRRCRGCVIVGKGVGRCDTNPMPRRTAIASASGA